MWSPVRRVRSLLVAELLKELLDSEAVPAKVVLNPEKLEDPEAPEYMVLVAKGKEHVAEEVFRKI